MQFYIDNMTCGGCARGVTKAIHSVDADAQIVSDLPKRFVEVKSSAARAQIETALRESGFLPRLLQE